MTAPARHCHGGTSLIFVFLVDVWTTHRQLFCGDLRALQYLSPVLLFPHRHLWKLHVIKVAQSLDKKRPLISFPCRRKIGETLIWSQKGVESRFRQIVIQVLIPCNSNKKVTFAIEFPYVSLKHYSTQLLKFMIWPLCLTNFCVYSNVIHYPILLVK